MKFTEKEMKEAATSEERPSSTDKKPHMFPCYLCGRLFGVASIYIHEPQCLKKWRAENDKLPIEKRRPTPPKPDIKFTRKLRLVEPLSIMTKTSSSSSTSSTSIKTGAYTLTLKNKLHKRVKTNRVVLKSLKS